MKVVNADEARSSIASNCRCRGLPAPSTRTGWGTPRRKDAAAANASDGRRNGKHLSLAEHERVLEICLFNLVIARIVRIVIFIAFIIDKGYQNNDVRASNTAWSSPSRTLWSNMS